MSSYRKRKATAKDRANPYKRARTMVVPRTISSNARAVRLGAGPVPQRSFVTLKYCIGYQSPSTIFDKPFNLNSIYSPEVSGGHQPLGRDQYGALYNRYRVWSCSARVQATSYGTKPMAFALVPNNSTSTYSAFDVACEQKGAIMKVIPVQGQTISIYKKFSCRQITGTDKKGYMDDRFQALFGATPTENIILHLVFADTQSGALGNGDIQFRINLEYYVELFDPLPLAAS